MLSISLPSCSFQFICMQMWDYLVHQPPPCHTSSPPQLLVSAPPTSLDECFFFKSLVVRLPYSAIFWPLWLFFLFKLVVILLLVVQGSKAYLPCLHLGYLSPSWLEVYMLIVLFFFFCLFVFVLGQPVILPFISVTSLH